MTKKLHLRIITLLSALFLLNAWVYAVNSEKIKFPVGFGSISPSIELKTIYDDNIFSDDDGSGVKKSWIGIVRPGIAWSVQKGLNRYNIKYSFESGTFFSSHDDDYLDHRLTSGAHFDFGIRNQLDLDFGFLKRHERRGTGLNDNSDSTFIEEPIEYRDLIAKAKYTYGASTAKGRIILDASYLDRKYDNFEQRYEQYDRSESLLGATFLYRFRPNSALFFQTNHKMVRYKNDPVSSDKLDNNETSAFVGITWASTVKTTGIAKIGYEKKDFRSSEYKTHTFVPWSLGLTWSPRSYSTFELTGSRSADESRGTGIFIQSTELLLGWNHSWSERISSGVSLKFANDDYKGSSRKEDTRTFDMGLDYLLTRTIVLGAAYRNENRDSNETDKDYKRNVFMMSAQMGF